MEFRSLTIMILFWYYTGGKRTRKGWRKKKNRKLDWSFRPWKQFVISLWHRSGLSRYLGSGIVSWKEHSKSHYKGEKCSDRVHEKDWRRKLGGAQDKSMKLVGSSHRMKFRWSSRWRRNDCDRILGVSCILVSKQNRMFVHPCWPSPSDI